MHRRRFLGSLLGLLGLGGVAKADTKQEEPMAFKRLLQAMRSMAPGGWSEVHLQVIQQQLRKHGVDKLNPPNPHDTMEQFIQQVGDQMELTGMGLIWMVPNALGNPVELWCIPTAVAIPQPAINPDYPDGYYRVHPCYPYGQCCYSSPCPSGPNFAIIPAQQMIRCKARNGNHRYDGYAPLSAMELERWEAMQRHIEPSAIINFGK